MLKGSILQKIRKSAENFVFGAKSAIVILFHDFTMKLNDSHRSAVSISAEQIKHSVESGDPVTVIDARSLVEFDRRHAQPAIRIPLELLERGTRGTDRAIAALGKGIVVVIGGSEVEANRAAGLLRRSGAQKVLTLERGMDGWVEAGLPTVRRDRLARDTTRLPVEVQVDAHSFVSF